MSCLQNAALLSLIIKKKGDLMGYYILGIIIFLLLIVFVSDLVRQSRDSDQIDEFDTDEYFNRLSTQYPGTFAYREEFSEDYLDKELDQEEGKTADMGVEPIWQNVEQQAFEQRLSQADKDLEDLLPDDSDDDNLRR